MNNIFRKISNMENISEKEVKSEISKAVIIAMKSEKTEAKAFWTEIAPDGIKPSPEEVIEKIAMIIKRKFYI